MPVTGGAVRLGIDFGTLNTVAVIAAPGWTAGPLLFDDSRLLRCAVCLDSGGRLLAGSDALHQAVAWPESVELYPKRHIDDAQLLLGGRPIAVPDLIAAVLGRVVSELDPPVPPADVVLTHPAGWGAERQGVLLAAASRVFPAARLVPEPVAAASYVAAVTGQPVPVSGHVVVCDAGAGGFNASLLRATPTGFEVVATAGLADAGGLAIDTAIVAYLQGTVAERDAAQWSRLAQPQAAGDRRASQLMWSSVQAGKEMLARVSPTTIYVPLFDTGIELGREQLDALATPIIARAVAAVRSILAQAGVPETALAGLFLVGGGSRMPAVGAALHHALGIVPTVVPQPELAVAEGGLLAARPDPVPAGTPIPSAGPLATGATIPAGATLPAGAPAPARLPALAGRIRPSIGLWLAIGGMVVALAGILTGFAVSGTGNPQRTAGALVAGSPSAHSGSPAPSPSPSSPVDPCLVGTWRSTNQQQQHTINGQSLTMVGHAGVVLVYNADGTFTMDYNNSTPAAVQYQGDTWTEVIRGTASGRVHDLDGTEYVNDVHASGTATLYRNGSQNNSIPLNLTGVPAKYFCSGDTASFNDSSGWVADFARVPPPSPSPAPPSPSASPSASSRS